MNTVGAFMINFTKFSRCDASSRASKTVNITFCWYIYLATEFNVVDNQTTAKLIEDEEAEEEEEKERRKKL